MNLLPNFISELYQDPKDIQSYLLEILFSDYVLILALEKNYIKKRWVSTIEATFNAFFKLKYLLSRMTLWGSERRGSD